RPAGRPPGRGWVRRSAVRNPWSSAPLYDIRGQKISQGLPRAKKLVLDRPERHALQLCDFLVRELAVMPEGDQLAVVVGQPADGFVQRQAQPSTRKILEGIGAALFRVH